jgi:hypothetical protein
MRFINGFGPSIEVFSKTLMLFLTFCYAFFFTRLKELWLITRFKGRDSSQENRMLYDAESLLCLIEA